MSELERLKSLLLTPEREQIQSLDQRTAAHQSRWDDLPIALPNLLEQAQLRSEPGRLGRALAEPVADALSEAVVRRRDSIVDALFPVIMPAIRRAIAESLRVLSADINQLLESSFTPRGIGWRVESWRSGRPYAEIALKHSLRYRVDYLLLIQSESGVVLDRESAVDVAALDSDAIAGMLTAIGAFVRDSVAGEEGEGLSSATVGEHLLWVIEGPHAKLAAFIRGVPPESLKHELQARLEAVHARFGAELALPPEQIVGIDQIKDALTPDDLRSSQDPATPSSSSPSRLLWFGLAVAGLLLILWVFSAWRWQGRVDAAEARLRVWPGFHLTDIQTQSGGRLRVRGLLDPLAQSPLVTLQREFPGVKIEMALRGYVSTDPLIAAKRLRLLFALPETVRIELKDDQVRLLGSASILLRERLQPELVALVGLGPVDATQLQWDLAASVRDQIGLPPEVRIRRHAGDWQVEGAATLKWQAEFTQWLTQHAQFGRVNSSGLNAPDTPRLDAINAQLLAMPVVFVSVLTPSAEGIARIEDMAALIGQAQVLARASRKTLIVDLYGLNDAIGTDAQNIAIRLARAQFLRAQLQQRLEFTPNFETHADSAPLIATIQSRAAIAQLRLDAQ